jgi:hypothetical protein
MFNLAARPSRGGALCGRLIRVLVGKTFGMLTVALAPGRTLAIFLCMVVLTVAPGASTALAGEYRFQTDYRITLNGLEIGRANLGGTFEGSSYRIDGSGRLTGLAGIFYDYSGSAAASGRIRAAGPVPSAYSADATNGRENMTVRMTLTDSAVRQLRIEPPVEPEDENHPAWIHVRDTHKRGIIDPMSALISFGGFDGRSFDRSVCNRSVPVFNGRERFDVKLEYSGIRTVTSNRPDGYSGPTLACTARYRAVAGHRSDKDDIRFLEERVSFEVLFAPVDGSDLLVPWRVSLSTPLGTAAIQAMSVVSDGALATRSAAR